MNDDLGLSYKDMDDIADSWGNEWSLLNTNLINKADTQVTDVNPGNMMIEIKDVPIEKLLTEIETHKLWKPSQIKTHFGIAEGDTILKFIDWGSISITAIRDKKNEDIINRINEFAKIIKKK